MLLHVVMFRPRPTLTDADRQHLADAMSQALSGIPSIRRLRVGRRITHGRGYEQLMRTDYPYIALIEFDDRAGLKTYLQHPAHEELGNRFFEAFEEALMYDYEVDEGAAGISALTGGKLGGTLTT